MYELRCLGEASLRGPTGQLIHFRSRKHFALLTYLSLNADRAHRRERLAGLLWSDSEDSRARHSLSQALYAVRRLLAGAVRIEGEDLELHPQNLLVDALQLQRLLESGQAAEAADLYRGDFLEGFWVRGAQGFEEWVGREKARVAGLARDALRRAIEESRNRCEWSEVRQRAERLVQLDPFDEAAQAELMRALWMLGDRAAALERYEELTRVLASELGSSPSRETEELAKRIRERSVRGGWNRRVLRESQRQRFDDPPFIGRKRELAALARQWEHVVGGETRHVALAGAAGIGKTRLAEEFFQSLALSDVTVLRGTCYEAESALPYVPLAEALRRGLNELELADAGPLWLAELARIVPEVTEHFSDLPKPTELDAEGGRRRLYEGIAQVLRAACDARPVLLFVDDLHWADDSSLSLLHYVRRRVSNGFYLLTAHRPEELAARGSSSLDRLLSDRAADVEEIELRGLEESESSHLLEALLGEGSDCAAVRSLREMSGGNPFFAIELARSLAEGEAGGPARVQVPSSIKSLLDRRFAGLDERSWKVLRQAAFMGSRSRYGALLAAASLPPLEFDAVIRELMDARILFDSEGLLCFRHSLIRELIVENVPETLSGALHRRVARALIGAKGSPGEIARHLAAGGDGHMAYLYALRGADEAEQIFALQEAADLLSLAIEVAPTESDGNGLKGRLGKLYLHMREYSLARPLLEERLAYLESSRSSRLALLEARRNLLLVDTFSSKLTVQESAREMKALYEEFKATGVKAPRLEAEVLHSLFWAAARSFNTQLVEDTIGRVRTLHNRAQEPHVLCRTARSQGIYECYRGNIGRACDFLYQARDSAQEAHDEAALVEAYIGLSTVAPRVLSHALVSEILQRGVPLAVSLADPGYLAELYCNIAVVYMYLGNPDEAEALLARASEALATGGHIPDCSPSLLYNKGYIAYLRSDYEQAERYWRESLELSQARNLLTGHFEALTAIGRLAISEGDYTRARRLIADALRLARIAGFLLDQHFLLHECLARLWYESGKRQKALNHLAEIAKTSRESDLPLWFTVQVTRIELLAREDSHARAFEIARAVVQVANDCSAAGWAYRSEKLMRMLESEWHLTREG